MPKPYSSDPRRLYKHSPSGVTGLLLVAFGVTVLVGLVSGVAWILWKLL
jgi:hypothetical protein